jgi:polyhydroxybutyrate depolymerase
LKGKDFFLNKEAKTLFRRAYTPGQRARPTGKGFLVLFPKKELLSVLLLSTLASCATPPGSIALKSGGETRSYVLVSQGATPRPLILALHGWLGTPQQMAEMSGLSAQAAKQGFDVAYPKGDWRSWGLDESSRRGAADAGFLQRVVADASARTPIDAARIFAVGFSNGGFMAQALACSGRVHLAGLAVVASGLAAGARTACHPGGPVPFLLIQGTADPIVPPGGASSGRDRILASWATLAFWARINGCDGFALSAAPSAQPAMPVTHAQGRDCAGAATEAWFVQGGGHGWPGSNFAYPAFIVGRNTHAIDATSLIVRFLLDRAAQPPVS